ncbi:MAG: FAD-dependent oxidoreductase [Phycisphaeraceae bacterium]
MKRIQAEPQRDLNTVRYDADLTVVGGGLSGVCCAITAAREGLKVVLIQDRPVLGGNASSEIRLWVLGATSHMGNNNRWAREGGVIDELLTENMFRNPEGNALIFDTILLEKVIEESNITLLLNTSVFELTKSDPDTIELVRAFCSQNSTMYHVHSPLFCDASGDGVVGFMAGAAFRIGAEARDEFDEQLAHEAEHEELLGHSMYFYTKDTGKPVSFTAPSFALKDITQIPRWRSFNAKQQGCQLWWIEFGGLLDTVHDTEKIKWELWKVCYGVWDHIKNSGLFPEAENRTLEWVGTIPGKRESRRFEGDFMLSQRDIVEQRLHHDAVSFGGWAIDLHPSEGVYSKESSCTQWHSKGVYQIPYRTMYSRNIKNLFLAGRIISASHIAFGSTRVMATCAHGGQAVAMAAAICKRDAILPAAVAEPERVVELQSRLLKAGQHIPQIKTDLINDLAKSATVKTSSAFSLASLPAGEDVVTLDDAYAMLLPVRKGKVPKMTVWVDADAATQLDIKLCGCSRAGSFTLDEVLAEQRIELTGSSDRLVTLGTQGKKQDVVANGESILTKRTLQNQHDYMGVAAQKITLDFGVAVDRDRYLSVCLSKNSAVSVKLSDQRMTGVLALSQRGNKAVSKGPIQSPPKGSGIDTFPFWLPMRRPGGKNLAMHFEPAIEGFSGDNLIAGPARPEDSANAWLADLNDPAPSAELRWDTPQTIREVCVSFDTDYDHPMESVLMGHPERVMPFCVSTARLIDGAGREVASLSDNHQSQWKVRLDQPIVTRSLHLEVDRPANGSPTAVMRISVFG